MNNLEAAKAYLATKTQPSPFGEMETTKIQLSDEVIYQQKVKRVPLYPWADEVTSLEALLEQTKNIPALKEFYICLLLLTGKSDETLHHKGDVTFERSSGNIYLVEIGESKDKDLRPFLELVAKELNDSKSVSAFEEPTTPDQTIESLIQNLRKNTRKGVEDDALLKYKTFKCETPDDLPDDVKDNYSLVTPTYGVSWNTCISGDDIEKLMGFNPSKYGLVLAGGFFSSMRVQRHVNDFDLFPIMDNITEKEVIDNVVRLINDLSKSYKIKVYRAGSVMTILRTVHLETKKYSQRIYQIIFRKHKTIAELLYGFDLPTCQVAWNGHYFLMTPQADFCMRTGCFFFDLERAREAFEVRLLKYKERGYTLLLPKKHKLTFTHHLSISYCAWMSSDTSTFTRLGQYLFLENIEGKLHLNMLDQDAVSETSAYCYENLKFDIEGCIAEYNSRRTTLAQQYGEVFEFTPEGLNKARILLPASEEDKEFVKMLKDFIRKTATDNCPETITLRNSIKSWVNNDTFLISNKISEPLTFIDIPTDESLLFDMIGNKRTVTESEFYHL